MKPILFSAPMVKAILSGRKIATRRVITPQPPHWFSIPHCFDQPRSKTVERLLKRYGNIGDQLWVRETFVLENNFDIGQMDPPHSDGRPIKYFRYHESSGEPVESQEGENLWQQPHYRATDPEPHLFFEDHSDTPYCKWTPSIFMPRWASRITLEISGLAVQRLQDITEDDAEREGAEPIIASSGNGESCSYLAYFKNLWEKLNGQRPGCSWRANPFVLVISFNRVKPVEDSK